MTISRTAAALVLAMLVAVIAAANLSVSARYGTLATPPAYDDVIYLLDAARRMTEERVNSLQSLTQSFLNRPPHAPLSTITAMVGYGIFGFHTWGPYVAGAWALGLFAAIAYKVARHQSASRLQALVIAGFLMFAPIVQAIVSEFRPDIAAGVIFAAALYLIVQADFSTPRWKKFIALGLAGAAAIVSKPSAFIVVVPILGLGVVASLACLGRRWPGGLMGVLKALLVALVPIVPYAIVWGPQTYGYIFQVFVTNKDIWSTSGSRLDHMLYHSVGSGGQGALGSMLYIGLGAIIVDLAVSLRRGFEVRIAAYYLVVALLYLGMGFSGEKTIFQGSFFYLPFLLAMAIALGRLAAALPWKVWPSAIMACAVAFLFPIGVSFRSPEARPELHQIADQIALEMRQSIARCAIADPQFVALAPSPVTPEAIILQLVLAGQANITPKQGYFTREEAELTRMANGADFVLFPNARGRSESAHLPGTAFIDAVRAGLTDQDTWSVFKPDVEDAPELWSKNCPN